MVTGGGSPHPDPIPGSNVHVVVRLPSTVEENALRIAIRDVSQRWLAAYRLMAQIPRAGIGGIFSWRDIVYLDIW